MIESFIKQELPIPSFPTTLSIETSHYHLIHNKIQGLRLLTTWTEIDQLIMFISPTPPPPPIFFSSLTNS